MSPHPSVVSAAPADTDHAQVWLTRGDDDIHVDELVVPLIEALWGAGCDTEFSCQGDDTEFAHVVFQNATSLHLALRHLLTLSESSADVTLTPRLAQRSSPRLAYLGDENPIVYDMADIWVISAWPQLGFEYHEKPWKGEADPLRYRLAFPHRDLLAINSAITARAANRVP